MGHVILGLALLGYGTIVLYRDRSRAGRFHGLSYLAGWISLTLWPPENSAVLDGMTAVPGVGRLLNDVCALVAVILQFAFITTVGGVWPRWRRVAVVVSGVLLLFLVPLWFLVRLGVTHNFSRLFYRGYYGDPPVLLAWNLLVGLAITYTCSLSFIGYAGALGAMRKRFTRVMTTLALVTYAVAAIYGVLVVAQLVADRLGYGQTGVLRYTGTIVITCVLLTLVSTGAVIVGRPVWRYAQQWVSLSRKQAVLAQLLKDNINANVLVSDQRVYLVWPAGRALVRAVDLQCQAQGFTAYQRKVAREATRWVILEGGIARQDQVASQDQGVNQDQAGAEVDSETTDRDDSPDLLADLSRRIEEDLSFFADAYRVARLVLLTLRGDLLKEDALPELEPRRELPGWRRDVAVLIVHIVRARWQDNQLTGRAHSDRAMRDHRVPASVQ